MPTHRWDQHERLDTAPTTVADPPPPATAEALDDDTIKAAFALAIGLRDRPSKRHLVDAFYEGINVIYALRHEGRIDQDAMDRLVQVLASFYVSAVVSSTIDDRGGTRGERGFLRWLRGTLP